MAPLLTEWRYNEALRKNAVVRGWVNSTLMTPGPEANCPNKLWLLPYGSEGTASTRFGECQNPCKHLNWGVEMDNNVTIIAAVFGAPEIVVPVGNVKYYSELSRVVEERPISIGVMSEPGTDVGLARLVADVFKSEDLKPTYLDDPMAPRFAGHPDNVRSAETGGQKVLA